MSDSKEQAQRKFDEFIAELRRQADDLERCIEKIREYRMRQQLQQKATTEEAH